MAAREIIRESRMTKPDDPFLIVIGLLLRELIAKTRHHSREIYPAVCIPIDSRFRSMLLPKACGRSSQKIVDVVRHFDVLVSAAHLEYASMHSIERAITMDPDHIDEKMIL